MLNCLSSKLLFLNDYGLIVFFQPLSFPALPAISFNLVSHWMVSIHYKEVEGKAVFILQIFAWEHWEQAVRVLSSSVCLHESVQWIHLPCHLGDQEGLVSQMPIPIQKLFSSILHYGICRATWKSPGDFSDIKKIRGKMLQSDLLLTRTLSNLSELLG